VSSKIGIYQYCLLLTAYFLSLPSPQSPLPTRIINLKSGCRLLVPKLLRGNHNDNFINLFKIIIILSVPEATTFHLDFQKKMVLIIIHGLKSDPVR